MNDLIRRAKQAEKVQAIRRLADRLHRSPTQAECAKAGIYFGQRNLFQNLNELLVAAGLGPTLRGRGVHWHPKARSEYRAPRLRRCEGCDQLTPRQDRCAHCVAPWIRTRMQEQ